MLAALRIRKFKSWADTGDLRLAPLTGLFGTNSSGKTSILQLLLLLKQTAESPDRAQVLNFGDERTLVDLGTYRDIIHRHAANEVLQWDLAWELDRPLAPPNPDQAGKRLFEAQGLSFSATIKSLTNGAGPVPAVEEMTYTLTGAEPGTFRSGMRLQPGAPGEYELIADGFDPRRSRGRPWPLPDPVKCYGFPDRVFAAYLNVDFLADLELAFEQQMGQIFYLGPLRDFPRRVYGWSGGRPSDMGRRGEHVIDALLAARGSPDRISAGKHRRKKTLEERVALWLKELDLITAFRVAPVAEGSSLYQVLVQRAKGAEEVPLTDVGFGVSQILPVLTLLYYVPRGSTVILEQPEIHLHPSVQAGLGDVVIDAIENRNIQVIVESHSEHFLRRIQRRIAEGTFPSSSAALYFCQLDRTGVSHAEALDVDDFGNIRNWPENFFGDGMGEIVSMARAQQTRKLKTSATA